jgi:hypothetical protein
MTNAEWHAHCLQLSLSLSLMLRPTVSRPVCLGIKHPSGAYDQILITVAHLRVCWCGALSLTRGRVCRLQLLLALDSTVILGSEPLGTRDRILLSQIWDFPFRRLLRLAGSLRSEPNISHHVLQFLCYSVFLCLSVTTATCLPNRVLGDPLTSNVLPLWLNYSGFQASCHNTLEYLMTASFQILAYSPFINMYPRNFCCCNRRW